MNRSFSSLVCLVCVTVAAILLAGFSHGFGRVHSQVPAGNLSQNEAVRLLRMINTAELSIFNRSQSYAPLAQVLQEVGVPPDFRPVDSSLGTLRGYSISVIVSGDGKHYVSAIVPLTSGCGFSAFSRGEVAVVHVGVPLGCPAYQE